MSYENHQQVTFAETHLAVSCRLRLQREDGRQRGGTTPRRATYDTFFRLAMGHALIEAFRK